MKIQISGVRSLKKRLLFIMPSLLCGGAEKSLVTLLGLLDYERIEADLLLFRREGLFLSDVPPQVNIISSGEYEDFDSSFFSYAKKHKSLKKIINRFRYALALKKRASEKIWQSLKKSLPVSDKKYDAAIAYLQGNPVYYCVDCVKADKKIAYIHSDYTALNTDKNFDKKYFEKLSLLLGVSDECCAVLKEIFPEFQSKIRTLENIVSPAVIKRLGEEKQEEIKTNGEKFILTVARLSKPKGCDLAVEAAEILNAENFDFKWLWVGEGEERAQLEAKIREKNLADKFILLGEKKNPCPYYRACDIYVQPSRFEGKSIAVEEAKCFFKPIVATRFSTVGAQLENGKTALLCEINPESLAEKISALSADENLQKSLSENLKRTPLGNEAEIRKFYQLLEE